MPATYPSIQPFRPAHISWLADNAWHARLEGDDLALQAASGKTLRWRLRLHAEPGVPLLSAPPDACDARDWLAALDSVFALHPASAELQLDARQLPPALRQALLLPGDNPQQARLSRQLLWQQDSLWLPAPRPPFGLVYGMSGERRHPLRPPKPQGVLYRRHIPWLGQQLVLRTVDPQADLQRIHRWMNDPVVAHFWEEQGELSHHRQYLERNQADPHVIGLVGELDGTPFAYFEVYWAKEDRIAPFYDAGDHDRGWHALVGEAAFRGRPFLSAWLPSLSHYLFLDDCRTRQLVVEPRQDNLKMRKNLSRCGYALVKEFDFPHKRAVLGMLSRERFFSEAVLIPQSGAAAPEALT